MRHRMGNLLHSFRYRAYVWTWLIVLLANTASWSFTLGVTWQIYALTHSSFWSGAIMFASMAPNLLGAPLAGVLADRLDRRRLMMISIVFGVLVLASLAVMSALDGVTPIVMSVLAVLFGLAMSTLSVSVNATVPGLVPKDRVYNAYSLQAVAQRGTEFVGPALSAPLLASFGPQAVYWFCTLTFAVTLLFVWVLANHDKRSDVSQVAVRGEPFLTSLAGGFRYIRQHATIFFIVTLVGLHCTLTMAFMGILPQYANHLTPQSSFYGVLMSMIGLGSMASTLFFAGVQSLRLRTSLFWISAGLSGLSLAILGVAHSEPFAVAAIVFVGGSQALFMTLAIAMIQEVTDERFRGRVTSVYFVLAAGAMSVANWAYGALSTWIAPQHLMLVVGIAFTVIAGVYYGLSRNRSQSRPLTVVGDALEG